MWQKIRRPHHEKMLDILLACATMKNMGYYNGDQKWISFCSY